MHCGKPLPRPGRPSTMISLDTNVVLRFLLDDVPAQTEKATRIIETHEVYVTDAVVIEVVFVLEKVMELPRRDIATLITGFLGFANVTYNTYFLLEAIQYYEHHPSLAIVDCCAAIEAKAFHNQLATFDKRLANQGGGHVFQG